MQWIGITANAQQTLNCKVFFFIKPQSRRLTSNGINHNNNNNYKLSIIHAKKI